MRRTGAFCRLFIAQKIDDAPRDGRRRIEKVHRPRAELLQPREQQRVMRAGQHNRVGARAIVAKARRDLLAQFVVACRRAGQFGFLQA